MFFVKRSLFQKYVCSILEFQKWFGLECRNQNIKNTIILQDKRIYVCKESARTFRGDDDSRRRTYLAEALCRNRYQVTSSCIYEANNRLQSVWRTISNPFHLRIFWYLVKKTKLVRKIIVWSFPERLGCPACIVYVCGISLPTVTCQKPKLWDWWLKRVPILSHVSRSGEHVHFQVKSWR